MSRIVSKKELSKDTVELIVQAPHISRRCRPGQFVIVRVCEKGERIPLTIVKSNAENISLVVQKVGLTTQLLSELNENDEVLDILGPLGTPTELKHYGCVVVVGGGVGVAEILPVANGFKNLNNRTICIIGFRDITRMILLDEIKEVSDEMVVTTDDGSYGLKGTVVDALETLLKKEKIDMIYTAGPLAMMKAVSEVAGRYNLKVTVSLNPIMVDGTGMCGCCRVRVGNEMKFVCVDGPDFDGTKVCWDEILLRNKFYLEKEKMLWLKK